MKFDQSSSRCYVFTYKEGLLSGFGHDLRVAVTSFIIELAEDAGSIRARFDADSLRVDCAMKNGETLPGALTTSDRNEIDEAILKKVLETDRYKDIVMVSSSVMREDSSYKIDAALTLHGRTREISFTVRKEEARHIADFWLHLPDFGIEPFSTLFGMIRIKPDILVRVIIPDTRGEKVSSQ